MRKDVSLAKELAKSEDVALDEFEAIARIWLEDSPESPETADFNEIMKYNGRGAKA
jgi:3-hydroxyisobutyrate dehydrogenase